MHGIAIASVNEEDWVHAGPKKIDHSQCHILFISDLLFDWFMFWVGE